MINSVASALICEGMWILLVILLEYFIHMQITMITGFVCSFRCSLAVHHNADMSLLIPPVEISLWL